MWQEIVIVLCSLVIMALGLTVVGLLVWVLALYKKVHTMYNHPAIWCYDDWQCNNQCNDTHVREPYESILDAPGKANPCFRDHYKDQLASCLYGPTATSCYNPQDPDWKHKCLCQNMSTNSCLSGCAESFEKLTAHTPYCCKLGDGCPNTSVPGYCQASNTPTNIRGFYG